MLGVNNFTKTTKKSAKSDSHKGYWIKESIKNHGFGELYHTGLLLGSGGTSEVHKCQQLGSNKNWAVKIIKKNSSNINRSVVQTEIGILLHLKHDNVIRMKEVIEDPDNIFMVLELVTGGELFDRIVSRGFYTEKDAALCVKEMLGGLKYLHENDVVHRDLKPENLLYETSQENSHLKIADFGLSKIIGPEVQMQTVCGTPGYCAPEVLMSEEYTSAIDMWSVGVIIFILLCGYEPFGGDNNQEMYKRILKCDYEFEPRYWCDISLNAKDLIKRLLMLEPKKRLTAGQALKHSWVTGAGAPKVNLNKTTEKLKEFNARRKLKAVQTAVLMATRASKHMTAPKVD